MKIRLGFVSNSSSSSFILSSDQVNKCIEIGQNLENNFEKILFEINQKDIDRIKNYSWLSKEEKKEYINDTIKYNEELLKNQIQILKNLKKYILTVNKNELKYLIFNNYIDCDSKYIYTSMFKKYPFSFKVYTLAQKLEKINKEFFNYIIKDSDMEIKNKRQKYNGVFWKLYDDIDWYIQYLDNFCKSQIEKKKIKNILKTIKNEIFNKAKSYIYEKIEKTFKNNNVFYMVEFHDGGGCGIYAPWLEYEKIKIPYLFKINNH